MKRILSCLLVALMLLPCIPLSASAAAPTSWSDIRPYISEDAIYNDEASLDLDFKYDSTKSYEGKIQFVLVCVDGLKEEDLPLKLVDTQFDTYGKNFIDYSNTNMADLLQSFGAEREHLDGYDIEVIDNKYQIGAERIDITFKNAISQRQLISIAHEITVNRACWNDVLWLWRPGHEQSLDNFVLYASLVEIDGADESTDVTEPPYLSTVNWDRVIDKVICLDTDKSKVPANYVWTADDFPELDVDRVNDNGYFIFVNLKNGGKENMIDAYNKLSKRPEFTRVEFDFAIPIPWIPGTYPVTEPVTEPVTDLVTTPVTETAAPTDPADETTCAPETGMTTAPQTGDALACVALIFAIDLLAAAAIVIFRKRRSSES